MTNSGKIGAVYNEKKEDKLRTVEVYSRYQISNEVEPDGQKNLISISTPHANYEKLPVPTAGWNSFIEMEFDDVQQDSGNYETINYSQASDLLKYIREHQRESFVVHCDAGVSRSVAIALFIRSHFGHDVELLGGAKNYDYHNRTVYERLRTLNSRVREMYNSEIRWRSA